jgi:hypothetical protein
MVAATRSAVKQLGPDSPETRMTNRLCRAEAAAYGRLNLGREADIVSV